VLLTIQVEPISTRKFISWRKTAAMEHDTCECMTNKDQLTPNGKCLNRHDETPTLISLQGPSEWNIDDHAQCNKRFLVQPSSALYKENAFCLCCVHKQSFWESNYLAALPNRRRENEKVLSRSRDGSAEAKATSSIRLRSVYRWRSGLNQCARSQKRKAAKPAAWPGIARFSLYL